MKTPSEVISIAMVCQDLNLSIENIGGNNYAYVWYGAIPEGGSQEPSVMVTRADSPELPVQWGDITVGAYRGYASLAVWQKSTRDGAPCFDPWSLHRAIQKAIEEAQKARVGDLLVGAWDEMWDEKLAREHADSNAGKACVALIEQANQLIASMDGDEAAEGVRRAVIEQCKVWVGAA
jgi:hypothetical protein